MKRSLSIGQLLTLTDHDGDRAEVRSLATGRLAEIDRKLSELQQHRAVLAGLIAACSGQGLVAGCPIIKEVVHSHDQEERS